jgi:transcriptional regulator with XRE-family HTH domain
VRVGQRVAIIREKKGITQSALARAADVPQPTLSHWESGVAIPADILPDLAKALGVSICELYGVPERHTASLTGSGKTERIIMASLSEAERDFLIEMAASLERYRDRFRTEEGLPPP